MKKDSKQVKFNRALPEKIINGATPKSPKGNLIAGELVGRPIPRPEQPNDDYEKKYFEAVQNIKAFIDDTYSVYTGVLMFKYEKKQITAAEMKIKTSEYRKIRNERLNTVIKDEDHFIAFYADSKKELRKAIAYARRVTRTKTKRALKKA